jgi:hypothetical protein
MEKAMRPRLTIFVAMLILAGPGLAQPARDQAAPAQQSQPRPAEVVLASAESVNVPTADSARPAPAPAKRRIARVTTCRCGDPQADPDSQNP